MLNLLVAGSDANEYVLILTFTEDRTKVTHFDQLVDSAYTKPFFWKSSERNIFWIARISWLSLRARNKFRLCTYQPIQASLVYGSNHVNILLPSYAVCNYNQLFFLFT
jgi:hypothetical protein